MVAIAPPVPGSARARRALGAALGVVAAVAGKAITPHKAAVRRLADIPLTVAGGVCVDFAAFHYVHMIGWLVTGVSLVLLEHLIADSE